MKCPVCGYFDSKVIDSRTSPEGDAIRRRRECISCKKRFTTYEMIEIAPITVVKKDGSREMFDRQKLFIGISKATEKRPVDAEEIVRAIEQKLQNELHQDVSSREIGEIAMQILKERDTVAYVRFASVYREFKDVETFLSELQDLSDHIKGLDKKGKAE